MGIENRLDDQIYIDISKGLKGTNKRIVAIKIYGIFSGVDSEYETAEKVAEYIKSIQSDRFKVQYISRDRPVIIGDSVEACSSAFIYADNAREGY
jgi:hypothetical protein